MQKRHQREIESGKKKKEKRLSSVAPPPLFCFRFLNQRRRMTGADCMLNAPGRGTMNIIASHSAISVRAATNQETI